MKTKTDNHSPQTKLKIRRYMLDKYPMAFDVLDCCNGGGLLWCHLRNEYQLSNYTPLDEKPKKGRLQIDSSRYLESGGWKHNVIDIDTYGSPWKHWVRMLPHVTGHVIVFLTIGQVSMGQSQDALRIAGIPSKTPPALSLKISQILPVLVLQDVERYGIVIDEAVEITSTGNARYLAVKIHKNETHLSAERESP